VQKATENVVKTIAVSLEQEIHAKLWQVQKNDAHNDWHSQFSFEAIMKDA
jgi:hypothetical protein